MGSETEPAKLLLPYLQRADELQKHEPLVAYYCRLYAMERGLKIPNKERTKTTNSLLVSLMNQLEKDKKSVKLGPEDNLYVEGFASSVFTKADKQDRAGRADLNTAKTFYAASIFYEILNQFGDLQPDLEQKQKYAVWKAADIRKAIKEGRRPEPGPPGGEKDLSMPSSTPSKYDLGPSDSLPASQSNVDNPPRLSSQSGFDTPPQLSTRSGSETPPQHVNKINAQPSGNIPTSPPPHPISDYPSGDLHQAPPSNRADISAYPQPYHHQSFSTEQHFTPQNYPSPDNIPQNYPSHENIPQNYPSENIPQNYPSHENMPQNYTPHESPAGSSFNYANFQTYPSFNDSTLPTAPSHHPSYYQGSDTAAYSPQSANMLKYPSSTAQYDPTSSRNGSNAEHSAPPAANYTYDVNYQPSVEKITEAHKAARFAVGALAFDDVPVAVDFLRRSLELLTNPSAELH